MTIHDAKYREEEARFLHWYLDNCECGGTDCDNGDGSIGGAAGSDDGAGKPEQGEARAVPSH